MHEDALRSYLTLFPAERAGLGLPPQAIYDSSRTTPPDVLPGPLHTRAVILSSELTHLILADETIIIPAAAEPAHKHEAENWLVSAREDVLRATGVAIQVAKSLVPEVISTPIHISVDAADGSPTAPVYTLHYVFVASESTAEPARPLGDSEDSSNAPVIKKLRQLRMVASSEWHIPD